MSALKIHVKYGDGEIAVESSLDKDLFWVKSEIYVFFFESLSFVKKSIFLKK